MARIRRGRRLAWFWRESIRAGCGNGDAGFSNQIEGDGVVRHANADRVETRGDEGQAEDLQLVPAQPSGSEPGMQHPAEEVE